MRVFLPVAALLLASACSTAPTAATTPAAAPAVNPEVAPPAAQAAAVPAAVPVDDVDEVQDDEDQAEETPVPLAELPSAVREAVEVRFPGARMTEAELQNGIYEVELANTDGLMVEVKVSADGIITE